MASSEVFDTSKYSVGWVCALPDELQAARSHLDAEHDYENYQRPVNEDTIYIFGEINKHNIVIAALSTGEYGTSKAASVARDLSRSFTNLKIGLLVGIAGGAPLYREDGTAKQDIRLGDVVVSKPENGKGGIFQHDYGKMKQGGSTTITRHLNSPPNLLMSGVTTVDSDIYSSEKHSIAKAVDDLFEKKPRLRKRFGRPDATTDNLYVSSYIHSDEDAECSKICGDGPKVKRESRDKEDIVKVHLGTIGSGNTLIKDAEFRDQMAETEKVLCFEMEAGGLMNDMRFLVVRGICDFADSHKNKIWQPYAAMTAAAYAKKLLQRIQPAGVSNAEPLPPIKANIKEIKQQVVHTNEHLERQTAEKLQEEIDRWLAAQDASVKHNYARQLDLKGPEGSGEWVIQSDPFQKWIACSKAAVFWLHGIAGCGKTVLASNIIESVRSMRKTKPVIYFYFDEREAPTPTFDSMLRALIRQMRSERLSCRQKCAELYSRCKMGACQPTTKQLSDTLEEMLESEMTIIVLDALDECTDKDDLLAWIKRTSKGFRSLIAVTSQSHYLQEARKQIANEFDLEVCGSALDDEILSFIKHELKKGDFDRWKDEESARREIEESLANNAKGMYLFVALQLEDIKHCSDRDELRQTLQELPKGSDRLNETYNRIAKQIQRTTRAKATKLLQFLLYCERPLTVTEAVGMLAIDPDEEPCFDPENRGMRQEDVTKLCKGFTRIAWTHLDSEPRAVVQLVHPSVRKYLLSEEQQEGLWKDLRESKAAAVIVKVCIAYLIYCAEHQAVRHMSTAHEFKEFAARYWMVNAAKAEEEGAPVLDWTCRLLTSPRASRFWLNTWLDTYEAEIEYVISTHEIELTREKSSDRRSKQLIIATLQNMHQTRKTLIERFVPLSRRHTTSSLIVMSRTSENPDSFYIILPAPAAQYYANIRSAGESSIKLGIPPCTQVFRLKLHWSSVTGFDVDVGNGIVVFDAWATGPVKKVDILFDRRGFYGNTKGGSILLQVDAERASNHQVYFSSVGQSNHVLLYGHILTDSRDTPAACPLYIFSADSQTADTRQQDSSSDDTSPRMIAADPCFEDRTTMPFSPREWFQFEDSPVW